MQAREVRISSRDSRDYLPCIGARHNIQKIADDIWQLSIPDLIVNLDLSGLSLTGHVYDWRFRLLRYTVNTEYPAAILDWNPEDDERGNLPPFTSAAVSDSQSKNQQIGECATSSGNAVVTETSYTPTLTLTISVVTTVTAAMCTSSHTNTNSSVVYTQHALHAHPVVSVMYNENTLLAAEGLIDLKKASKNTAKTKNLAPAVNDDIIQITER